MAYSKNSQGKCPHCDTVVQFAAAGITNGQHHIGVETVSQSLDLDICKCPQCNKIVISATTKLDDKNAEVLLWPRSIGRPPVPETVPVHIARDYNEAAAVLPISPKASAALSRRCMQAVLKEAGGATKYNLDKQIDELQPTLPSYLRNQLDHVRIIGNFAAHPEKSTETGSIVDVDPVEAEWNLDVLDGLFQHFYVNPAREQALKTAINKKLASVGREPLP